MKEQEAFNKLTAVVDTCVKNMNIFGLNEVRTINEAIDIIQSIIPEQRIDSNGTFVKETSCNK